MQKIQNRQNKFEKEEKFKGLVLFVTETSIKFQQRSHWGFCIRISPRTDREYRNRLINIWTRYRGKGNSMKEKTGFSTNSARTNGFPHGKK